MPRYTFEEGTSSKFWQIDLEGASFTVTYGRIGTAGQVQTKSFDSPADAQKEHDKLVREKTKKGYVADEGGADAPTAPRAPAAPATPGAGRNPELEAAIAADPDDPAAWLVYADWLQTEGDKLGEYLMLACRGETDPTLKKLATKMLKENAKAWLGVLAENDDMHDVTWKNGFLHTARVTMEYEGEPHAKKVLGPMLRLPTARFLQELTIGLYYDERETYEVNYAGAVKLMGAAGPMPSLRTLFIGDFEYPDETEISWAKLGNIGAIWALFPALEHVRLRGGEQKLGEIVAPHLRSFIIETGGLDVGALRSISKATWPNLESLEVWFGRDEYGWNGKPRDLLPLLQRTDLPRLRRLGLVNHEIGDAICTMVVGSPLLPGLSELNLSMSTIGDEGAAVLVQNAAKLAHLTRLDLSDCYLTTAGQRALKAALPQVVVTGQRTPDDWGDGEMHRYSSVGE